MKQFVKHFTNVFASRPTVGGAKCLCILGLLTFLGLILFAYNQSFEAAVRQNVQREVSPFRMESGTLTEPDSHDTQAEVSENPMSLLRQPVRNSHQQRDSLRRLPVVILLITLLGTFGAYLSRVFVRRGIPNISLQMYLKNSLPVRAGPMVG